MSEDAMLQRRDFLKTSAAVALTAASAGQAAMSAEEKPKAPAFIKKMQPSDTVNLGYVGVGVRGKQHMRYTGFSNPKDPSPKDEPKEDPTANLPRPLNVRAHAMSDCYKGNQEWAKGAVPDIKVYPNFEDLLADKNVDAIFIGTSDHNHSLVGIAAAQAGKHIYSEKSFANSIEAAIEYRAAVKQAGVVFQLGHQTRSGTTMAKAKKAIGSIGPEGALGKITLIETYTNRNNANGAWIYKIPVGAGPDNIDWARFTGKGPKRDFNLDRFFRFRKYWDYGTGQCGDLLTHEMDAIQQITGLGIPSTAVASGGIYYHKDGRETPDVLQITFNYEKEEIMVTYTGTLANSQTRERALFGHDATLDMTHGMQLIFDKDSDRPDYLDNLEKKKWFVDIGSAEDLKSLEEIKAKSSRSLDWMFGKAIYIEIVNGKKINVTALHALNFVECVRSGNVKTNCNIDMAFDEAVIAHMANQAYLRGRRVRWDSKQEKIVNDA